MVHHLIVIASSYKLGKRVAWHYAAEIIDKSKLEELKTKTSEILGKPEYAIHKLSTESEKWESVIDKDSFFDKLKVYSDLDEFLKIVKEDKILTALDIAKLVLSIQSMSNLKLQKIVYFVYAEYLSQYGKPLFKDSIIAYPYGPVIESIYQRYKKHGREVISEEDDDISLEDIKIPLALAKILQSDDAEKILDVVHEVFKKFGKEKPSKLVDITHRQGAPWTRVRDSGGIGKEITDELIKKYHSVEMA